jgi:hypothetical protein
MHIHTYIHTYIGVHTCIYTHVYTYTEQDTTMIIIQDGTKLLSGFPWPILLKPG